VDERNHTGGSSDGILNLLGKILDAQTGLGHQLADVEKTIVQMKADLSNHIAAEDGNRSLIASLESRAWSELSGLRNRVAALEAVNLRAEGAENSKGNKILMAVALALAGAVGLFFAVKLGLR
jgi:hypothetical protein